MTFLSNYYDCQNYIDYLGIIFYTDYHIIRGFWYLIQFSLSQYVLYNPFVCVLNIRKER